MATDPWSGARYPTEDDSGDVAQWMGWGVADVSPQVIPFFATGADRDTALTSWTAAGNTVREGMYCHVAGSGLLVTDASGAWQPVEPYGFLASGVTNSTGTVTDTTLHTVASITATVPSGLRSGRRIKVTGTVFVATSAGVGAIVQIQNGPSRPINNVVDGDLTAVFYDSDLTTGSRTWNLQVQATVSGGSYVWQRPQMSVEIV